MGLSHREHIDAPPERVWSYLASPGAMRRLMPAWQPLTPLREADSLRSGTAVLGLPGPLEWISQHRPEGFDPGRRFVDEVAADGWRSRPASMVGWRHTHRVEPEESGTALVDEVDTVVPGRLLRSMFRWRGQQLRDDLAALDRWRAMGPPPQRVAVSGASGMVGSALTALLGVAGVEVVRLVRAAPAGESSAQVRTWDPSNPDPRLLDDVDAVVHLAGAPIGGRFTEKHRNAVRSSRVGPTRRLAEVAAGARNGPGVFVSASAIGWYGANRAGEDLDEASVPGDDFLAGVCRDWEADTAPASTAGLRTVQLRTGIVMSAAGGVLRMLRPLYTAGVGGRLGDGNQQMSWIDLEDLCDLYLRALVDPNLTGPVNGTAPEPVSGAEFARTLGRVLHRPAVLPVPAFGPRLLLGRQGAEELALADQRVLPAKAVRALHSFRRPELTECLAHQLGRESHQMA